MENPSSPLDTLRQLKEMLDAGALTPAEFEVLKQRLVLAPAAPDAPVAPGGAPTAPLWAPATPVASNAPAPPPASPPAYFDAPEWRPALPAEEAGAQGIEPAAEPQLPFGAVGGLAVAAGGPGAADAEALADDAPDLPAAPAERNSSLGLVLAIGAVLVFLAAMAYLGFTRPASEHIASTSQTAADSVAAAVETGPQVAPLPAAAPAAPETVRVAPTSPAPALPARPQAARQAAARDSAAPAVSPAAPDSAVRQ